MGIVIASLLGILLLHEPFTWRYALGVNDHCRRRVHRPALGEKTDCLHIAAGTGEFSAIPFCGQAFSTPVKSNIPLTPRSQFTNTVLL